MTPADLEILVQQGEGTTLEFKESLSSSFAREVVALANTVGGRILLGVRDDGDRHFFPEAYITCLLGRGTDKVHILDRKDFDGGIVSDVEDAMRFVERNTRTGVDPIWWTPDDCAEEVSGWEKDMRRMRRSTVARWWSWCARAARPGSWLVSSRVHRGRPQQGA